MYKIFEKIPEASSEYIKSLIFSENISIKLKKSRKTKQGDFSVKRNGLCMITINDDLNQYRFLITLIHEISHYIAYKNYGPYIKPHGAEWKNIFKNLLLPIINPEIIPNDLLRPLAIYAKNPKASSDIDLNLSLALNRYNINRCDYVFSLSNGSVFKASNDRVYVMTKKLRKRYECMDILTKKLYLFSPNASIKEIIND
tara:strand:+ start:160 stop:756 length:597 start_codon:yes stop_codon:yes gene_type:complete